jgi:hypothetical protein
MLPEREIDQALEKKEDDASGLHHASLVVIPAQPAA